MMGVDYDLFWTLNPSSLEPFIKAFKLRQEYIDTLSWSMGQYVQLAVASIMDSKVKYPEKPVSSTRQLSEKEQIELFRMKMIERMRIVNQRFKESDSDVE